MIDDPREMSPAISKKRIRQRDIEADPDSELIGWMDSSDWEKCWMPLGLERRPGKGPVTRGFYREFLRVLRTMMTDEDRARCVVEVQQLIEDAHLANRKGKGLKAISDKARMAVGEIPKVIPEGGFPDINAMTYPECLTVDRIEKILLDDLRRMGLLEWLRLAAKARNA